MNRISLEEYFTQIAKTVSLRSTCPKATVGAIVVNGGIVISTGYNGSPSGYPHCIDVGCTIVNGHCISTVHAEANAIIQSKGLGTGIYCTHLPCIDCCKLIITAKLYEVHFSIPYIDDKCKFFGVANQQVYLEERGVSVIKYTVQPEVNPIKDV